MNPDLTADQAMLRDHMRSFFQRQSTTEVVRRAEPLGFDDELWRQATAVGIPGMALPADVGGGGSSLLDASLVVEEYGRVVAPIPVVEHMVAGRLLARLGHKPADGLEPVAEGEVRATLALAPSRGGLWSLVPAGAVSGVVAGEHDGAVVVVASPPPMAAPPNMGCLPIADRKVAGEGADQRYSRDDEAWVCALDEWKALTASALVGLAAQALDIGVDYAKQRHQFDRPIGAFQAVQHGLADLVGSIDGARLLAAKAAWACDHDDAATRGRLASMALLFAAEVAGVATARSLHFHGGYGVMQEYDIQLLYRRARAWALIGGDPDQEYLELADRLFGGAEPSPTAISGGGRQHAAGPRGNGGLRD